MNYAGNSANLTSVMCWVIIAQTIASPDPSIGFYTFSDICTKGWQWIPQVENQGNWDSFSRDGTDWDAHLLLAHRCALSSVAHVWQEAPGVWSSWEMGLMPSHKGGHLSAVMLGDSGDWKWDCGISSLRLSQSLSITCGPQVTWDRIHLSSVSPTAAY